MRGKYILPLLALVAVASLAACGGKGDSAAQPEGAQPAAALDDSRAAVIYKNNCSSCHGMNLEGRIGPQTNLQKIGGKLTKEQIAGQIANGGKNMIAFKGKLKEEEIDILAEWLAAKK
jgi:cytochrome c551